MNAREAREMKRNGADPLTVLAQFTDLRLGEAIDSRGDHIRIAPEQVRARADQLQDRHGDVIAALRGQDEHGNA